MVAPPSLADLAPIVGDLDLAEPRAITELKSDSNAAFRIDLADGSAVVLKTYDELRGKRPDGEAYAAHLLDDLDVPVTRYLARDESLARLPFRYAITNYLPGSAASTFRDDPDVAGVYHEMGALSRQLHAVRLPAFGHFAADGVRDPVADNRTYMQIVATHAFAQFDSYGADPALAARLREIVAANTEVFAASRGAAFAHDDFHINNILADRDPEGGLHLSGLVDFGNARAADPVFDLAKALFMSDHDAPEATAHILAGYGPIDHPDPERALWLYTLLHRVVMWWWLRHVGVIADGQPSDLMRDLEAMAEQGVPAD